VGKGLEFRSSMAIIIIMVFIFTAFTLMMVEEEEGFN
jgi:hypothetical protein